MALDRRGGAGKPVSPRQHTKRRSLHGVGGLDEECRVLGGERQPFVVRFALCRLGGVSASVSPYSGRRAGQQTPSLFTDLAVYVALFHPPPFPRLRPPPFPRLRERDRTSSPHTCYLKTT